MPVPREAPMHRQEVANTLGIRVNGDKVLGVVDGTAGAAGGGDIRGVQAVVYWKHNVGSCRFHMLSFEV
jgi:hypothetical protein